MAKSSETALAMIDQFAIMTTPQDEIAELFEANLAGSDISISMLDRIKFPSGGALFFEIPGPDGPSPQKAIEGVIVARRDSRQMWLTGVEDGGSGNPPDCAGTLVDFNGGGGKQWVGYGDRDKNGDLGPHDCAACPYALFGSADKGSGKKCKDTIMLALLTKDSILPVLINIPPTSISLFRKYCLQLAGQVTPTHGVITRIGLAEAKNEGGIKYAQGVFSKVEVLSPELRARMKQYGEMVKPWLERTARATSSDETGSSFAEAEDLQEVTA